MAAMVTAHYQCSHISLRFWGTLLGPTDKSLFMLRLSQQITHEQSSVCWPLLVCTTKNVIEYDCTLSMTAKDHSCAVGSHPKWA